MEEAAEDENRELRLILWFEEEEGCPAPLDVLGMSLGLLMVVRVALVLLFAQTWKVKEKVENGTSTVWRSGGQCWGKRRDLGRMQASEVPWKVTIWRTDLGNNGDFCHVCDIFERHK